MLEKILNKINGRVIDQDATLRDALKLMDKLDKKLLLVLENNSYKSLLSIGDIQRAIIKNVELHEKVKNILRKNLRVCSISDSEKRIKETMLEFRIEFMPILNKSGELSNIVFWEELFEEEIQKPASLKLKCPVVIMAGGEGKRMRPFTNIIPKPLFPIGEKPIIEVIMDKFNSIGSTEFYLTVNYKFKMLKYYIDNNISSNYSIKYIKEDKPLGTAGSLSLLKNKIKNTFFVSNCDIIIEQDLSEVYKYHKENKNELTIIGSLKHYDIPYGVLETGKNGKLLKLKEKPELTHMINTGVYILEPHLLNEIPLNTFFHITDLITKIINRNGKVGVFPINSKSWLDIGEWTKYWNASKMDIPKI
ncbi:MAG: nucleotidyltransferase family protein [Melioribacteraceae bacterium]|nr:nucleotidyltransferase family protein [Melioribacteraceae bacterium]